MRKGVAIVAISAAIGAAISATVAAQPAATLTIEQLLRDRLGIPAASVSQFTAGQPMVMSVPGSADTEIAVAGAVRVKGDLRRLTAWLRDIESFMKATGSVNVGAIASPATSADFARITLNSADLADLRTCRSKNCSMRMPEAFMTRFQNEVAWTTPQAPAQATSLGRTLVAEYVNAYQKGGDAGLAAFHDASRPREQTSHFVDMLRQSTKVWDLSYPFVNYLETYPKNYPAGTESRFYWTRDEMSGKPALTLHHVVLQELSGGRVLAADKQFYASREIDAGLMIAFAVPNAEKTGFDLAVVVKARSNAIRGVAARVLRGRIDKGMREGLASYLTWMQGSFALP
jgi:hypothetical protein